MPSNLPLPTITQLVRAGSRATTGEYDVNADVRSGSLYNHCIGPMAVLCSREADRDQNMFEDIYFNSASGDALTTLIQQRFQVSRILDTYGAGTCLFVRPTATGGGGTIYTGTRIQVPGNPASFYQVSADTVVGSSTLSIVLPIQATVVGTGTAISASSGLTLPDPIYDNTFVPMYLQCNAGTDYESAADYRARTLLVRRNRRTGYLPQITLACQNAGAAYVLAFPSQYGLAANNFTGDFGLNALYVADDNFQSSPLLIASCQSALESWRVLGADMWVGGTASIPLTMNFLVSLTDVPANLPTPSITRLCAQAVLATFGPTGGGYTYSAKQLTGAVNNASPYVQTASVPRNWTVATQYNLGDSLFANGAVQQCTTAGESAVSEPTFSNFPGTVTYDGSVQWTCSNYPSVGIFAGGSLQLSDPTLSSASWPASIPRYSTSFQNIQFTFTGPL